jgi:hypothetical protein
MSIKQPKIAGLLQLVDGLGYRWPRDVEHPRCLRDTALLGDCEEAGTLF